MALASRALPTTPARTQDQPWSPDGARIAFTSTRDGTREVYAVNADGSGLARVTDDGADDFNPAWSPDGNRIAFTKELEGNREIYVINVDGSGLRQVTEDAAQDQQPVWAPDVAAATPSP